MRFAYADPPYPGQARRHYSQDERCAEVDSEKLVDFLEEQFPDGWALSSHEGGLDILLPICRERGWTLTNHQIRMGIWLKPFHIFKPGVNPSYGWEPVLFRGGRKRTREQPTLKNFLIHNITLKKGLVGVKPEEVAEWVLDWLNVQAGDEFYDIYPGSGVFSTRARERGAIVTEGLSLQEYEFLNLVA